MVPLKKLLKFEGRKRGKVGDLVRTLRVRMLVFVFQLQINRPKRICVMVLCLVDHVKFCSRYLIFNFQFFPLMFLKFRFIFRFTICFRCSHFSVIIFDSSPHLYRYGVASPVVVSYFIIFIRKPSVSLKHTTFSLGD